MVRCMRWSARYVCGQMILCEHVDNIMASDLSPLLSVPPPPGSPAGRTASPGP